MCLQRSQPSSIAWMPTFPMHLDSSRKVRLCILKRWPLASVYVCVSANVCISASFPVNVAELDKHQKEQSEKMMDRSGIVKLTEKIYFSGKYEGAPKVCHEEGKCCPLMSGCDMKRAAGMPS